MDREASERERALASFYGGIAAASGCSPEDLELMRDQNPYLYALASTGTASALDELFKGLPDVKDAIDERKEINISARDLSGPNRQILLRLMSGVSKMPEQRGKSIDSITPDGNVQLFVNLGGSKGRQLGGIYMHYGRDDLEGVISCGINFRDPYPKPSEDSSVRNDDFHPDPNDPALSMKADVKVNKTLRNGKLSLADYQSALAEAMEVNIVSDDFGHRQDILNFKDGEVTLGEFTERFCNAFQYDWQIKGSVLELRDCEWFEKRSLQIPEVKLENLRKAVVKNHKLSMNDLASVGRLSQAQYDMNIADDNILDNPHLELTLCGNSGWLDIYQMLSTEQRNALFGRGVDFKDLDSKQRTAVSIHMLQRRSGVMSEETCTLIFAREIAYGEKGVIIEDPASDAIKRRCYTLCGSFDGLDHWMSIAQTDVPVYVLLITAWLQL